MARLTKKETIMAEVDDEVYLFMKRIQFMHDLNWVKARDYVNASLSAMYSFKKCDRCRVLLTSKNVGDIMMNEQGIVKATCSACTKRMWKSGRKK